jgi:hypothetical protein
MESAMSHCPSSDKVVRCAAHSGAAKTIKNEKKIRK